MQGEPSNVPNVGFTTAMATLNGKRCRASDFMVIVVPEVEHTDVGTVGTTVRGEDRLEALASLGKDWRKGILGPRTQCDNDRKTAYNGA